MYWIKFETNIEKKKPKKKLVINRKGFQNLSAKLFAINMSLQFCKNSNWEKNECKERDVTMKSNNDKSNQKSAKVYK